MVEDESEYRDSFDATQQPMVCILNVDQVFEYNRTDGTHVGGSVSVAEPL